MAVRQGFTLKLPINHSRFSGPRSGFQNVQFPGDFGTGFGNAARGVYDPPTDGQFGNTLNRLGVRGINPMAQIGGGRSGIGSIGGIGGVVPGMPGLVGGLLPEFKTSPPSTPLQPGNGLNLGRIPFIPGRDFPIPGGTPPMGGFPGPGGTPPMIPRPPMSFPQPGMMGPMSQLAFQMAGPLPTTPLPPISPPSPPPGNWGLPTPPTPQDILGGLFPGWRRNG